MKIHRVFTINANADKVWDVLGNRYAEVDQWASSVNHSASRSENETVLHGAPCNGRVCETELGPFKETITYYDEANRVLSYDATGDKMPFFVKNLNNRWQVTPKGNDSVEVDMLMTAQLSFPFNFLMAPMMKMQMGGILKKATEELKHFIETGSPHPRKAAAMAKVGAAQAT